MTRKPLFTTRKGFHRNSFPAPTASTIPFRPQASSTKIFSRRRRIPIMPQTPGVHSTAPSPHQLRCLLTCIALSRASNDWSIQILVRPPHRRRNTCLTPRPVAECQRLVGIHSISLIQHPVRNSAALPSLRLGSVLRHPSHTRHGQTFRVSRASGIPRSHLKSEARRPLEPRRA